MTDIKIDPTKLTLQVEVKSLSMHALGFDIVVYDMNDKVLEEWKGSTQISNPWVQPLKLKPADSQGKYISGIFNFKSPDGTDYPYKASFSLLVENKLVLPVIILSGTTEEGSATTTDYFHVI